jgi:NAD(P)-dependent dehydrogenase (short-subunit alcohol dehydrogenase family)
MSRLLDTALDRTIVPGYSRIGYLLRRRGWPEGDPAPGSMSGRRVLVTGANSGLGKAAAADLARLGATVHLVVRNEQRGTAALREIAADVPGADLHLELCDVSDLTDVRRCAADLTAKLDRVDVLVHNAGALPAERTESPDGHELTVATHVLGPVLLTELLLPLLEKSDDARVILVSSGGMYAQRLPVDDPDYLRGGYSGTTAYARSKRIQVALTPVLQERWSAHGVTVHTMHPGWADTPGVASSLPVFRALTRPLLRDAHAGADTIVWLAATRPGPPGGHFWQDRAERPTHYRGGTRETPEERARMWQWVRTGAGLEDS